VIVAVDRYRPRVSATPKSEARGSGPRRSLGKRAARALRYRATKQYAYLDLGRSSASTVLVVGTQRSGTTWLAEEVLNHDNRYRMIFEPLHEWKSTVAPPGMAWAQYLAPDDAAVQFRAALDAVMAGRIRSRSTDFANQKRVTWRRIVKCVSATNLLPWLHRWHPRMTTVHVIRHPFAVAHSLCQMGWHEQRKGARGAHTARVVTRAGLLDGPLLEYRDAVLDLHARCTSYFTLTVLRWCLENFVALRMVEPSARHHVVHYERLVLDPASELEPLMRLGIMADAPAERFRRPSRTDFQQRVESARGGPGGELAFIAAWQDAVAPEDLHLGMTILEAFGLDDLYGLDPLSYDAPGGS
jgi:hypothetical protein